MKAFQFSLLFFASLVLTCTSIKTPLQVVYTPPVTFTGVLNGTYDSLCGNFNWQNRCFIKDDTLCMYFYTKKFNTSKTIRHGDFIRLFILPKEHDSTLETPHVIFHCARYYDANSSYEVSPIDTVLQINRITMRVRTLEHYRNGRVSIDRFYVSARAIMGTYGEPLEITNGRIEGVIQ